MDTPPYMLLFPKRPLPSTATESYGFLSSVNSTLSQGYSDISTFLPIQASAIRSTNLKNFSAGIDASTHAVYLQYNGASPENFVIMATVCNARFTNTTKNSYALTIGIDSGSGISPVDSGNDISDYTLQDQAPNMVAVPVGLITTLTTGNKVYVVNRNTTVGSTSGNNDFITPSLLLTVISFGIATAPGSGVDSLNGQSGVVNENSSDNSLTITTPSPGNIDIILTPFAIGNYSGTPISVNGATSPTIFSGRYKANGSLLNATDVEVFLDMMVTTDNSGQVVILDLPIPFGGNFTDGKNAIKIGFNVLPTAIVDNPSGGAIGSGWYNDLFASTGTKNVRLYFEGAQTNTQYRVTVAFNYQVQP